MNVELMQGEVMMNQSSTSEEGMYELAGALGDNYEVVPHKSDNYLNGVSTIDLVQIQRHILTIDKFDSPYKVIAADANNDGRVNGIDLVTLRKLILGITPDLPNGQLPWRFPTEAQSFDDIDSPFPFTEIIGVNELPASIEDQNFVAVKVGDVNADAVVNLRDEETDIRSGSRLTLEVADQGLVEGTVADVTVTAQDMEDVIGFQTTWSFNADVIRFSGVTAEGLDVTEANLGLAHLDDGYITFSWNTTEGVTVEDFRNLFTLHFEVLESANLSEQLFLSSVMTKSEAYNWRLGDNGACAGLSRHRSGRVCSLPEHT